MKNFLYVLRPMLLLCSITPLPCNSSVDSFAYGLKTITEEASVTEKEEMQSKKQESKKKEELTTEEKEKLEEIANGSNYLQKSSGYPKDKKYIQLMALLAEIHTNDNDELKPLALKLIDAQDITYINSSWVFDAKPHTLLLLAIDINDPELVKKLLEKGADPNKKALYKIKLKDKTTTEIQNTPLLHAARAAQTKKEILHLLLTHNADPFKDVVIDVIYFTTPFYEILQQLKSTNKKVRETFKDIILTIVQEHKPELKKRIAVTKNGEHTIQSELETIMNPDTTENIWKALKTNE